jgi:hypothetical protein
MMLGQGSGVANASLVILLTNAGSLSVTLQGAGGYNWAHPTTVTANTWHHIAVTRNGTSFVLYLDGVGASYTAVESFVFDNMANNTIGTNLGSATYHRMSQCYIDDFRITKNVLRYGSNFILPSVEFESLVANDFPTSFYNQYWDETKLLLQGDYVGSNTAIIQDNSKYGFNPAPVNGAVVSNTQAKWGTHSLYFDGTGDGLNCSLDSSLVINGDYTIESWVYQSSGSGVQILICWNTNATNYATAYLYTNGGALTFHASNDGSSWGINAVSMGVTLTTNRWYHVALTRNGSSIKCWIDGVQLWSGTLSGGVTSGITKNCIGIYPDNSSYGWNGYMDDFRITKGVARYTQNFIPPTAAFTNQNTFTADPYFTSTTLLVHADGSDNQNNNTIVDSSAGNKTVTRNGTVAQGTYSPFPVASGSEYSASVNGGSAYFNGSGDYLTLDGSADFAFGDGDFTIEAWVRFGATNRHQLLLSTAGATTAFTMFALKDETDQVAWGGAGGTTVGTTVLSANVWYHIAAVRSSGVVKMYLNGSQELSVADNNSYTTAANLPQVGAQSGLYTFQGHISNLNIIKGTAKYTATFTVPTAPVAAHANTKLLLNFTNAAIRDETAKHIIKVSGDTKTMVAVNKYGNSSMYFDGSGDYLTLDGSADFAFGSGDWTIEMWVYKTANGLAGGLMGTSNDASLTNQFAWYINSGTPTLYFTYSGGSVGYTTSVPTAQWVHLAVCKSGTYIRQFINGIVDGNVATNDNTSFTVDPNRVIIGAIDNGSNPFAGYIDDVRITKGVARYVGNFVPPTAAFLNK